MSPKYAISTIVIICAIILVVLAMMGPKMALQLPPIQAQAMEHIQKHNFLTGGETLEAFKATSYYSYNSGVVVTNTRVFAFANDKIIKSIALNKITMVIVKDSDLGRDEVMVSGQADGVIGLELTRADALTFVKLLHIPDSMIKHFTRQEAKEALHTPAPAKM